MSSHGKFVIIVSMLWCTVGTFFMARRSSSTQLLFVVVGFLFLSALIAGIVGIFKEWRERRWLSFLPVMIWIVSFLVTGILVHMARNIIFAWSLPGYESVIHKIETGEIPVSTNFLQIPQAMPEARLAYSVFGGKDANGVLTVQFFTESGFPVHHSGYLYISSGVIAPDSPMGSRWPILYQISPKRPGWFCFSD